MIVLAGLLGAIPAALVAYLLAARRMSGQIETSDATELWAESAAMRVDYREQIAELNRKVAQLETAAKDCKDTIEQLEATIRELRKEGRE